MTYDVIVVGAGPGGGFNGQEMCRRGPQTLLLEKRALP